MFSAEHSWSPPRVVTLKKGDGGFGFSVRGSRPVVVTGVDKGGQAEVCVCVLTLLPLFIFSSFLPSLPPSLPPPTQAAGTKAGDWLLAVNGTNLKHVSHKTAIQAIKDSGEEVTFELTTPATTND